MQTTDMFLSISADTEMLQHYRPKVMLKFTVTVKVIHCVSKKNRTRILWSITFTNIGQYQCHLTELFVQQYLIIYRKSYSYRRVPAATVTMATSTTRADQRLSMLLQRTCPSCMCHRRVFAPRHT